MQAMTGWRGMRICERLSYCRMVCTTSSEFSVHTTARLASRSFVLQRLSLRQAARVLGYAVTSLQAIPTTTAARLLLANSDADGLPGWGSDRANTASISSGTASWWQQCDRCSVSCSTGKKCKVVYAMKAHADNVGVAPRILNCDTTLTCIKRS